MLRKIRTRLVDALTLYLAQPVKHFSPSTAADTRSLCALLRRGDVLLTEGNTRMAVLVKGITRSPWTHVSMYVGPLEAGPDPRCVVEADVAAGVRAVALSEFTGLRVRVLRPTALHETDRRRLADWVVSRIGAEYDLAHAWALARRLLRLPLAPVRRWRLARERKAPRGFICSSLLAQAFVLDRISDRPGSDRRPGRLDGGPQVRHSTRFRERAPVRGGELNAGRLATCNGDRERARRLARRGLPPAAGATV